MADWKPRFAALCQKTHTEQAKWWLNGFWDAGAKDYRDKVWDICHKFIELDIGFPVLYGGKMKSFVEGCDLDEMKSHVILEKLGETMTVRELRARLAKLDLDNNKRMALSEFLLDKYKKTPLELVNSPQGTVDPVKLKAAENALAQASAKLDQAVADAESAAVALANAKAAATAAAASAKSAAAAKEAADKDAAAAAKALEAQKAAEAEVQKAVDELNAAIAELNKQEADYNGKIAALQAQVDDASLTAMKKSKASNELAQLKSEDPMPLRKAKITQGAALKRVEKEKKKAEQATAECAKVKEGADASAAAAAAAKNKADADKVSADETEEKSALAKTVAEKAKAAAEESVKAAEKQLNDLKSSGTGSPQGMLWWMEKTLQEKKKFMK